MPVICRIAQLELIALLVVAMATGVTAQEDTALEAVTASPDVLYEYDETQTAADCCQDGVVYDSYGGYGSCPTCNGCGPCGCSGIGQNVFQVTEHVPGTCGPCGQMACRPLPPCPPKETVVGTNHFWQVTGLPQLPWGPHHGFLFTGCYWPVVDCADYRASWYIMGELMPLRRDNGRTFDFASQGAGGPIILRSGDRDFEDDFNAGARVVLGRALGDWYRIEASYTGGYEWSDTRAVRDSGGNIFSPFGQFGAFGPVAGVDQVDFAQISFSSEMNTVELNLRRAIAVPPTYVETSFLVGARYMRLEEDFQYLTNDATPGPVTSINDVQVATENDLLGIQLGLLTQFRVHQRGWIDFDIKGVFFANDASQRTQYRNVDNNGIATTAVGAADDETTAYLGDLSLTFNYQCSRAFTFRAGYNAWFMTGVSLAADNFERNLGLLQLGPANVDHRGRMIYHGPSIGLVGAW